MTREKFIDLYDFLGIPPASPPNLIYLAILKMESATWENFAKLYEKPKFIEEIQYYISSANERLLRSLSNRSSYEEEWEGYYFPHDEKQTNIEQSLLRIGQSSFLSTGLRYKSLPGRERKACDADFTYSKDFIYFMVRDISEEREVFFLNPSEEVPLFSSSHTIFFQEKQFYLRTSTVERILITNDAMGKTVLLEGKDTKFPLNIGDRIEFANGARFILRSIYTNAQNLKESEPDPQWSFYFQREKTIIPLAPGKAYIVGRNTSDIRHLALDEDVFAFVNIGRRERSISRQNFQTFYHKGQWYIQDLGSRYGTTLDFQEHPKLETLAGGSIMPLERGRIRLGYEKCYMIDVDTVDRIKIKKTESLPKVAVREPSIYDIPLI
jgi:hypothetical protein